MDARIRELDKHYKEIGKLEKSTEALASSIELLREVKWHGIDLAGTIRSYESKLAEQQAEIQERRAELMRDLLSMQDPLGMVVLQMYYYSGLTLRQIAESQNYSDRWVMKVRDKALEEVLAQKEKTEHLSSP